MTPNKVIITSVALYTIILAIMYIGYSNLQFTDSDAAGNGMTKGLTFFYGLGVLFIIAIAFTVINTLFFKGITTTWIKFLFFVPISLPLLVFMITFLEVEIPKRTNIKKQDHRLTFEIRTKEKLENVTFSFRTSKGGSHSKLSNKKEEGFYVYESKNAIYYEDKRIFYIKSGGYETSKHNLEISYEPQIIPFTNWEALNGINKDTKDTIKLEFRYKITNPG